MHTKATSILFSLILLFFSAFLFAQKQIYITLDASGSMRSQKYEYANYGAQMIQVLNQEHNVTLITKAQEQRMKGKNAYKKIQNNYRRHNAEVQDVAIFTQLFNPNIRNQELFIIGDGHWGGTNEKIKNDLSECINSGNLRVTFLEVLNNIREISLFEQFLEDNNLAKIYKTDNNKTLASNINTIVEEITGVSSLDKDKIFHNKNCLRIVPDVNVKKVFFLYQDAIKTAQLPKINEITIDYNKISANLLGEPSTEKFLEFGGLISSRVYEIDEQIAGGTAINICFDKDIDINKIKIFPITDIELSNFTLEMEAGGVKIIDENSIGVCADNEKAVVKIDFKDQNGKVTEGNIKNTKVVVISNGKKYKAQYENGVFEAEIPLSEIGNETTYRVESELKGYFRRNSGEKKIVKIPDCERDKSPIIKPMESIGTLSLDQINRKEKIILTLVDEETKEPLNPRIFDIEVDNNYTHLFKDVNVTFNEDEKISLTIEPRGFWCDCFIPDELILNFNAKPKHEKMFNGKYYRELKMPLKLEIEKKQSLFSRCKWLIFSIIGALFLMWYFIKLSKKNRFRKGAKVVFKSPSVQTLRSINKKYINSDYTLRKKGFVSWFGRWFNPFASESRAIAFHKAGNANFKFIASPSFARIEFPKSNFKEDKMSFSNYDEDSREKLVKFDENSELTLKSTSGFGNIEHFLAYSYPKKGWNDIVSFRWVLRILVFFLFIYALSATILLINTIFNFI